MTFVVNAVDLLILQAIFVAISCFLGYILVVFPTLNSSTKNREDHIQILCYSLVCGMAVMVVPLHLFSLVGVPILWGFVSILILAIVIGFMNVRTRVIGWKLRMPDYRSRKVLVYLLLFCGFVAIDLLAFWIPHGLAGSTNSDAAYHTFFIRIIIDNGLVIWHPYPYYEYLLFNPSGPHLLGAIFTLMGLVPIQATVISFGAIFPALTFLAGYSYTRSLTNNDGASVISALLLVTSNQFWQPLSFTFTIQIMQFIVLAASGYAFKLLTQEPGYTQILAAAMLLALSAYVHPVAVFYILILGVLPVIVNVLGSYSEPEMLKRLGYQILRILGVACLALLLWLHNGLMVLEFVTNPEFGLPSDWITPAVRETWDPSTLTSSLIPSGYFWNPISWIEESIRHGGYYFLGPILIFLFVILKLKRAGGGHCPKFLTSDEVPIISILVGFMLVFVFLQLSLIISLTPELFHIHRVWEMLFIPLSIMSALTIMSTVSLLGILYQSFSTTLPEVKPSISRAHLAAGVTLLVCISSLLLAPVHYQSLFGRTPAYIEMARLDVLEFNRMTIDDIRVFEWIEENTSRSAVFLTSQVDAGEYLTSVTKRQSVYPFGPAADTDHYRKLTLGLAATPSNPYLISLLSYYNITHVFVGSLLAEETTSTWEDELSRRGGWTKDSLYESPILEEAFSEGASAVFRVKHTNLTYWRAAVTVLGQTTILSKGDSLDGWSGNGTGPFIDMEKSFGEITNSSIGANMTANSSLIYTLPQPLNLHDNHAILLWMQSTAACSLRIQLSDENYQNTTQIVDLGTNWSCQIVDLTVLDSLSNITEAQFVLNDFEESCTIYIGSIAVAAQRSQIPLREELDAVNLSVRFEAELPVLESALILLPKHMQVISVEPVSVSWMVIPENILYLDNLSSSPTVITMSNATLDHRSEALIFISRTFDCAYGSGSNTSLPVHQATVMGPWGNGSILVDLCFKWGWTILSYTFEQMNAGIAYVPFFLDGASSDGEIVIEIYASYDQAQQRECQPLFRTTLSQSNVWSWCIMKIELINSTGFHIRIDNHDGLSHLYIGQPLLYSRGLYF